MAKKTLRAFDQQLSLPLENPENEQRLGKPTDVNSNQSSLLMQQVLDRTNLIRAFKQVTHNKGVPGVDGVTVEQLPEYLKHHWGNIKQQLLNGTYKPQPVKRVEIPKPEGRKRKLGIGRNRRMGHSELVPALRCTKPYQIDTLETSLSRLVVNLMSECKKARNELLQWEAFISLAGFMLNNTDGLPCDGEGIYQNSVKHVQTCKKCRTWVESKILNEEKARLERIEKYCCPVMYRAVEQNGQDEIHLKLLNFQGCPTWAVTNFETVGGNLLIGFCPWCGAKMPSGKFIDEQ